MSKPAKCRQAAFKQSDHWLSLQRDRETGIETIQAHFTGHAYDLHDHDDWLIGVTLQGVQQFQCRRQLLTSTPGRAILIEPLERHDGESPLGSGFTYAMLYVPQTWLAEQVDSYIGHYGSAPALGFRRTLSDDPSLSRSAFLAFKALHDREGRLARDLKMQTLLATLMGGAFEDPTAGRGPPPRTVVRARELLDARFVEDISLEELAAAAGCDRFRLNRLFQESLGVSPHRYLVLARLRAARAALATGRMPAAVAADMGFADQSHMGRWFRRAYRMTPAAYRRLCTSVPD